MEQKSANQLSYKVTYLKHEDKVCPVCGSSHIQNVSRITGYLSLDERFGAGKVAERNDRIAHNRYGCKDCDK
mgnify:FL=1